jgi:hypothetical protein
MVNGFILKKENENEKKKEKKNLGAVKDLPDDQHSQSGPLSLKKGWIVCAYFSWS